ncbi:hypothetical protein BDY17DRAFT_88800 [Neohortaea acidophila]|uniref:Uncharacterized protein n=1 Tax=Neohortaea acidophila TaxID=245834 RepID=A0A6A6Q5H9_9PEZI|nr:uncharacterized protein BDY17DRAFT_88800 [Neohortaea acidophila]KAF2486893.1 hypothetical protein BDY17DRAFT_88800 [Neohortaea acidophila]
MRFVLLATLIATVCAFDAKRNQASCADVHKSVQSGGWQGAASRFCSSWYPTSTITTTVTSTSSLLVMATATTVLVTTSSSTTTTTTVTATCGLPTVTAKARRDPSREGSHPANPKPACFAGYTAPWAISSACSCLGITAPTKTLKHERIATTTVTRKARSRTSRPPRQRLRYLPLLPLLPPQLSLPVFTSTPLFP